MRIAAYPPLKRNVSPFPAMRDRLRGCRAGQIYVPKKNPAGAGFFALPEEAQSDSTG